MMHIAGAGGDPRVLGNRLVARKWPQQVLLPCVLCFVTVEPNCVIAGVSDHVT